MGFCKEDLSMSTSWNYAKATCGEELIDQLLALGFSQVELNYRVRREWLPAIERYIAQGRVKISSVHNVFPKGDERLFGPDSVLLGEADEALRKQAVELAKQSIDWAVRLGARAVVFHPTEVPLDPKLYDEPLKRMVREGKKGTDAYRELYDRMLKARRAQPYMDRMMRSLEELSEYVVRGGLNVRLGIENRAMCHQIPIFSEYLPILDRFAGGPVGVWIDTGHAVMMEEIGLQALPLDRRVAENIVGMHIHDAKNAMDHYAPCTLEGDVLAPFRAYMERCPIRVLEIAGRISESEIIEGTERFIAQYGA